MLVKTGLEVLLGSERRLIAGRRFGLLTHPAAVGPDLMPSSVLLAEAFGAGLVRLFAPEHGLGGLEQDMAEVREATDPLTGRPVVSLYRAEEASLGPAPEHLEGLDALVADLQDVGSRYYTFQSTLALAMQAAREKDIELVVLDRPNPLGGLAVEGPGVEEGYRSFVGIEPVPVRHGMTLGELARYYAGACGRGCRLSVVPMEGWSRAMWFDDTGLPWVMPSPNMPTLATATVYPGGCLVEGTNLSEGRGTPRPFELVGAPWIEPLALVRRLRGLELPGVAWRPASFRPTFHKHAGQACGGVQAHVTERGRFEPFLTGLALVSATRLEDQARFDWRREPYEFVSDRLAFDLLTGSPRLREAIEAGEPLAALRASWQGELEDFLARRRAFLLYD